MKIKTSAKLNKLLLNIDATAAWSQGDVVISMDADEFESCDTDHDIEGGFNLALRALELNKPVYRVEAYPSWQETFYFIGTEKEIAHKIFTFGEKVKAKEVEDPELDKKISAALKLLKDLKKKKVK